MLQLKKDRPIAELILYGIIGEQFAGAEIIPRQVAEALREVAGRPLLVRINSPGGDAAGGVAIYNLLRSHRGGVTVQVDAEASSAASVVAMAGAPLRMAESSWLMIHEPWGAAWGDAEEMRRRADELELIRDQAAAIYNRRVDDLPKVQRWIAAETWFRPDEALAAGLADEIGEPMAIAARATRPPGYRHEPPELTIDRPAPWADSQAPDVARWLTAAGRRLKEILADKTK